MRQSGLTLDDEIEELKEEFPLASHASLRIEYLRGEKWVDLGWFSFNQGVKFVRSLKKEYSKPWPQSHITGFSGHNTCSGEHESALTYELRSVNRPELALVAVIAKEPGIKV